MQYVYIKSEPNLYTVGFYRPDGRWEPESDWTRSQDAAKQVHYLNGGTLASDAVARHRVAELTHQIAALQRYSAELEKQLEPEVVQEIRTALSSEKDLACA